MSGRIVVNARALQRPMTGVERYTAETLVRLGSRVQVIHSPRTETAWAGHLWEQLLLPRQLEAGDLLWSPANTGPLAVARQVLTLHDLSVFDHPESFVPAFRHWYRLLLPLLARRAARVITDSEFSRRRIIERLGLPPEKVIVIHCGIDRGWFYPRSRAEITRLRERHGLPENYFLFVGSLEPRKNVARLLQAWAKLGGLFPDLGLVIAGRAGRAFRQPAIKKPPEGVLLTGYVSEEDLPVLYSGAQAVIMPSLYEGFGLPVLEALACGTPVLCSRIAALQEAAGPAGLYFNPADVEEIAGAMARLANDSTLRRQLIQQGRQQIQGFSWERTTGQIWEVLSDC